MSIIGRTIKNVIKKLLFLVPFMKTLEFFFLERTREQGENLNTLPSVNGKFYFRQGNYDEDYQDICTAIPDELFPGMSINERNKIILDRFDKGILCFVVRENGNSTQYNTAPLVAAMWATQEAYWFLPRYPEGTTYSITNLFVVENARGQGLSNFLLQNAVQWLFEQTDCQALLSIVLNSREASLKSHLRVGFKILGKQYLRHIGNYWHLEFKKTE